MVGAGTEAQGGVVCRESVRDEKYRLTQIQ